MKGLQEQQSQWTIPDTVLRSNMKDAIAEDFLPSYNVRALACACHYVSVVLCMLIAWYAYTAQSGRVHMQLLGAEGCHKYAS